MILRAFLLGILLPLAVTAATRCEKGFTASDTLPDDELMNAFYIADPDPRTGYVTYYVDPQKRLSHTMIGTVTSASLNFKPWLRKRHDGQKHFQNLWVYVSRLIASDIRELYGHYQSLSPQASAKPRAAIDFEKLKTKFSEVCTSPSKFKAVWPFSCFESKFFCALKTAMDKLKPLLQMSSTSEISQLTCKLPNVKPLFVINKMSNMAVDTDQRAEALKLMFVSDIVNTFDAGVLERPLYRSGLVRDCIYLILSKRTNLKKMIYKDLQSLTQRMTTSCTENEKTVLGTAYYCKARDILTRTKECYSSTQGTTCRYQAIFQEYFEIGRFVYKSEFESIEVMRSQVKSSIEAMVAAIVKKDEGKIKNQMQLLTPFIDVDPKRCYYGWPKAIDCGSDRVCQLRTLYRMDCVMYFLTKSVNQFLTTKGSSSWTDGRVVIAKAYLNVLLFYPPYLFDAKFSKAERDLTITTFHETVDKMRIKFDLDGFYKLVDAMPPLYFLPSWVGRLYCSQGRISELYKPYCVVSPLVNAIAQFTSSIKNSKNSKTRALNPSINYKTLLEQLQLGRISAYLTKQSQTYFQILSKKLDAIPKYIQDNFQAVGRYFQSLATYDIKKSTGDVTAIQGYINGYKNTIMPKLRQLATRFGSLVKLAFVSAGAEIYSRLAELVMEIAINCNPLKHIFGGSNPGAILDRTNTLMKSAVGMAQLVAVVTQVLPNIAKRVQKIRDGYDANADYIALAQDLVDNLNTDDPQLEAKVDLFLFNYTDYTPQVKRSDISGLGTLWEAAVDKICEVAYAGGSAASSAVQLLVASKADCLFVKPLIAEVITATEAIYDFQFQMFDKLEEGIRARYASKFANDLGVAYTTQTNVDMEFMKSNAIVSYLVSTMHVWGMVSEYCNILTYTSGGTLPDACKRTLENPNHDNVARVISHAQDDSCNAGSRTTTYVKIPTNNPKDISHIDLTKLFKGQKTDFQIPDSKWLISRGLIPRSEANNAFFVEQFQLFLPGVIKGTAMVQIVATPSDKHILRRGGKQYVFSALGYKSMYKVNYPLCFNTKMWLPYDYCHSLPQICVVRNGKRERKLQPSIYNKWSIKLTDPDGLTPPNPKTSLNVIAGLTFCTSTGTTGTGKKRRSSPSFKRQASAKHCCNANKYWSGSACAECPAGSKRQLSGYYCQ